MDVRWSVDEKVRAELHFFTGLSYSGSRTVIRILHGGRRQGPELEGDRVKSCCLVGPIGTRMVLQASESETGWEDQPWRALVILQGSTMKSPGGQPAVQVPDLDRLDRFDARRVDPDTSEGFRLARTLAEGSGWTYAGDNLRSELKCNVRGVRLDLVRAG